MAAPTAPAPAPPPASDAGGVLCTQGYLFGLGGTPPVWKKRYFKLTNDATRLNIGQLQYFAEETDSEALSSMEVDGTASVVALPADKEGRSHVFALTIDEVTFYFSAPDEGMRKEWVDSFRCFVRAGQQIKESPVAPDAAAPAAPNKPAPIPSGSEATESEVDPKGFADLTESFQMICQRTELSLQATKETMTFFKKRIAIEDDFHKSMSKLYDKTANRSLIKRISKKSTLGEKELGESVRSAWYALEDQTQAAGDTHNSMARKIEADILTSMSEFVSNAESKRKQLISDGNKRWKELQDCQARTNKQREALDRAVAESRGEPVEKKGFKFSLGKKNESIDDLEATLKAAMAATGDARLRYNKEMPVILKELEDIECKRMECMGNAMRMYMDIQVESIMMQQQAWPSTNESIDKIDPKADIQHFVAHSMTDDKVVVEESA